MGQRVSFECLSDGAYIEAGKAAAGQDSNDIILESRPPISVCEVVDLVQQEFGDRVVFHLKNRLKCRQNQFEDCRSLYEAMRFLATTFYLAKTGIESCTNLKAACRRESGFSYEPHQSKHTMGRFSRDYTTTYKGRRIPLGKHIGKGRGRDARRCIRVGFEFLEDEQIIVVGYIGQHQKTLAS